jgi:hypothetical protein
MSRKRWLLAGLAGVVVLGVASYVAVALIFTGTLGLHPADTSQRRGYEVIPPTEVPQSQPDVVGPVLEARNQSFMVQPEAKGAVSANYANVEIVIGSKTRVYQDITKGSPIQPVDGKIQQRVQNYDPSLIKVGDMLIAWGDLRGTRLVADAVIVEVMPAVTPAQ